MEIPCSAYFDLTYFFAAVGCLWVLVLAWWCSTVYGYSRQHTRTLHKVVAFVLFFKTLFDICSACFFATCPFKGYNSDYWNLAVSSTYTLYYTFLYTFFLLVSKGYCVTRYVLARSEVTVVAVVMGIVYLGFSAYTMNPEPLSPLLIFLIIVVFMLTTRYTYLTLSVLRRQIRNLQMSGIQDIVQPAIRKLKIMNVFSWCLVGYFVMELTCVLVEVASRAADGPYQVIVWMYFIEEILETPLLILLFIYLRPKFHGDLSTLPLVDASNPSEIRPIPPLIKAGIPHENLTDFPTIAPNHPIVILHPVQFSSTDPYLNIEIGQVIAGEDNRQRNSQFPILFGR